MEGIVRTLRARRYLRRDEAGEHYRVVERMLEVPMLVLALILIPVILGPVLFELSDEARVALEVSGVAIWLAFAVEYLWLFYLAPDRRRMVRTHKLDLLLVLLPFLRPLRFARLLRIAGAASGMGRAAVALRRIGGRPGVRPFLSLVVFVVVLGAAFALAFEHDQPGASIDNYADALWWALVTCTTVGYGDHFPVTAGGKAVAAVLMVAGIASLSLLTASIAAMFVDDDDDEYEEIRTRLARMEALLERGLEEGWIVPRSDRAETTATAEPDALGGAAAEWTSLRPHGSG